jgi:hypothetical protein
MAVLSPEKSGRVSNTNSHSPRPGGRSARGAAPDVGEKVVPYAELKNGAAQLTELDTDNLEAYLATAEFDKIMGLTRDKFYQVSIYLFVCSVVCLMFSFLQSFRHGDDSRLKKRRGCAKRKTKRKQKMKNKNRLCC